jgi:hypothetical protein
MLGAICSSCNKRQAEGTNKKLELNKQKTHFSRMLMLRKKRTLCLFGSKMTAPSLLSQLLLSIAAELAYLLASQYPHHS